MSWIKTISNILTKAVKFTAFVIIIAETLQFLATKIQALDLPEKTQENDN